MTEEPKITQHDAWLAERDRGQKVHNMLQHPGWTEVLEPLLQSHRRTAVNDLMNADLKKLEDFIIVRQSIKAIDLVLTYAKTVMDVGEKAALNLKKETQEQ
jgi:hypothetical protein